MNSSYIILMLLVYNFSKLLFTLIYLFLFIYFIFYMKKIQHNGFIHLSSQPKLIDL